MRAAILLLSLVALSAFAAERNNRQASCRQDRRNRLCSADDSVFRLRDMQPGDTTWYGTNGVAGTTTRPSTATCPMPDGGITTLANNVPCITCLGSACGLYTEPSGTNLLLQSSDLSNASWAKEAGVVVTGASASCPANRLDGTRMDLVDNTAGATTASAFQGVAVTSSTGPFVVGFDVATTSGTATRTVGGTCGSNIPVSCVCSRSDGASCTASVSGSRCNASSTASTTPVRVTVSYSCNVATTSIQPFVIGGNTGATGQGCYDLAQFEMNGTTYATTYIPTTTATASRAGVKHEFPTPAALSRTEGCARVTVTPIWTGTNPFGSAFNQHFISANAAGTARLGYNPGVSSDFATYDGTHVPQNEAAYVANTAKTYRTTWSASGNALVAQNATAATSASTVFTTFPAYDATVSVGGLYGSSQPIGAVISGVVLGTTAQGCTR